MIVVNVCKTSISLCHGVINYSNDREDIKRSVKIFRERKEKVLKTKFNEEEC